MRMAAGATREIPGWQSEARVHPGTVGSKIEKAPTLNGDSMLSFDRLAKCGVICATLSPVLLGAICLLSSCNNTCVFGVVNPPNNSVTVVGGNSVASVCSQAPITGVTVGSNSIGACTNCAASQQVTHAYLAVSGVEFHSSTISDANSPDWQELAPELAQHPQLVDLVTNSTSEEDAFGLHVSGRIPVGKYYEVRLQLAEASTFPKTTAEFLTARGCASATRFGCIVNADGSAHELRTLDGQQFLLVQSATPIDLRADRENRIQLQFHPEWLLQQTTGGMELAPVLLGEVGREGLETLAK
jgi:hypothetical protein